MNLDHADIVGIAFLVGMALLSGYFLLLRIKEFYTEKPDPKLTYATIADLEKLRGQLDQFQRDTKADLDALDQRRSRSVAGIHELIRKNAEHIAALIAQIEMAGQRLSELTTKTERLQEKIRS